jgi:isocitrate dehydrogenase kinase/phosphatase
VVSDNIYLDSKNEEQWNSNIKNIGNTINQIIEDTLHKLVWDKVKDI